MKSSTRNCLGKSSSTVSRPTNPLAAVKVPRFWSFQDFIPGAANTVDWGLSNDIVGVVWPLNFRQGESQYPPVGRSGKTCRW